ncbi:MAG: 3-hydroxyacyl-CoA dehydrogenase/enoyl-CoA hydratase family protein [Candidatus Contendobacter sp.]|jgi:3-hydroxyacyl-CoA dehydrogenase|nr:3-hydroxyacyl-CoA dehydrogenase/enoyl-CoA hydratase family protein [Gammaproteobacteria bacterium]MCC8992107.1 3-hydroxyacyl-CoA dehydrogenase/enoyl-CoA hydratase family protein [Candidatus Contendobacter sp.]
MSNAASIRRVAVLGAGVMGAQIAAHLANAEVPVVLFDLPAKDGDPNGIAVKAIANLGKLNPAPFAVKERAALIKPANYDQHLEELRNCDLLIEAIAERPDWKADLYQRITPYLNERAILATNTSGLRINMLAESVPDALRSRFCGIHFFNPPRYMALVELIPCQQTDPAILDQLETFLVTTLGKSVVRAKDTPNFIANRIGVFSMAATIHHTAAFGLSLDLVDALTGPAIGRPKSATYRTADVVGLDTMGHVFKGSALALQYDPWRTYFTPPDWLNVLIAKGALGQKTGAGIYAAKGKQVLNPATGEYQNAGAKPNEAVQAILKIRNPAEKFAALRASDDPQAQFLWAIQRDVFHYAAVLLAEIADTARDIDLAIRGGFGWSMGPFEIWQAAGWKQVADWINEDIAAGKAMTTTALPAWVADVPGVHTANGSYSAAKYAYKSRSTLPVYQRQLYPELVLGEAPHRYGETVFENTGVRLWTTGDNIGVLSFKSKMHVIGDDVLDGVLEALNIAEQQFDGLVLWQTAAPFSAGANLAQAVPVVMAGDWVTFENTVAKFQHTTAALRYSAIPVVAAAQGLALGGGCEFLMHCDRVVAALESYIGLVEVGVGLIPAGGGCKEFALRAMHEAKGGDLLPFLRPYFEAMAMAKVSRSAEEAKQLGHLKASDIIVFNVNELLYVAKAQVRALAETGYRPPQPRPIRVAGRTGVAACQMALVNMRDGGFISAHDYQLGLNIATALCGGDVDPNTMVDEAWLLGLERQGFLELAKTPLTQARIEQMLKTGKPLRN